MLQRIVARLARWIGAGWHPLTPWGDPVSWNRRTGNVVADALANRAMDIGEDWKSILDFPHSLLGQRCNFLFHSDGGTRVGQCSGTGWILEAFAPDRVLPYRVAAAATFIACPISSFTAECLALDHATEAFDRFLRTTAPV